MEISQGQTDQQLGRAVYNYRCYFCHGYNGDARTVASTFLAPPPRDFTQADSAVLTREDMIKTVREGRSGTAMQAFGKILTVAETEAVVDFIRDTFMAGTVRNTRYHTPENGWPNHDRYAKAFPFVLGSIPIDRAPETLTTEQKEGKRLYMSSCITCHDRAASNEPVTWDPQAISYPRGGYSHRQVMHYEGDAVAGASPFAAHEQAPKVRLNEQELQGEMLFQKNCAFCHAADGTGRNWIGSFLESPPRDLTASSTMKKMTKAGLKKVIKEGLPGTTMSAWKTVLTDAEIEAIIAYISRVFHPVMEQDPNEVSHSAQ